MPQPLGSIKIRSEALTLFQAKPGGFRHFEHGKEQCYPVPAGRLFGQYRQRFYPPRRTRQALFEPAHHLLDGDRISRHNDLC